MDLDEMHGTLLRHDATLKRLEPRVHELERNVDTLLEDRRSLRLWLAQQFGEIKREIEQLGRSRDDDTTAIRTIKAAVRRDERRRARAVKVAIGVASPLFVELVRRLLNLWHW